MATLKKLHEDWQADRNTQDAMWHMFEHQVNCDVFFEVGSDQERIGAHSAVLMARSMVWFRELAGEVPTREIILFEVEPEEFNCFLRYLYTGRLQTDGISVDNLLKLAEKYCVRECVKLLVTKQLETMDPETFCPFVRKNEHHMTDLMRFKCFEYVFSHPFQVFHSASFPYLPYSFLKALLGNEYLVIDEDVLCTAVLLWASQECRSQKMEENGKNQRLVLQDALYLIRFPLLSQDYFTENISESQLLSDKEELQLYRYLMNKNKSDGFPFNINKRKAPITPFQFIVEEANPRPSSGLHVSESRPILTTVESVHEGSVLRFKERGSGWGYRLDRKDAVAFEVNKDIILTDVYIYGNCKENGKMEVSVSLQRDTQSEPLSISMVQLQCELSHATGRYEVGIENDVGSYGIKITAGVVYHIVVEIKGTNSYYGKHGIKEVISDGITFSFKNSYLSTNNTNVDMGQIAGLKFHILPKE
ncbi:BTB/POZ domain-containing protein 6-B-like [Dreissena polymorpha]|uniref:BTB domain-containing protein n=1 Tax=Dreissena polymorpha TaxID=45954 RepID=A0A9D4MK78_DREPO|nr:BTB/POZ domain-containing protein 6-B-like [Dreissena polymorpha]KAH3877791.1 hypothetical protein DPMN_001669 [Dreissena polymorpha]